MESTVKTLMIPFPKYVFGSKKSGKRQSRSLLARVLHQAPESLPASQGTPKIPCLLPLFKFISSLIIDSVHTYMNRNLSTQPAEFI